MGLHTHGDRLKTITSEQMAVLDMNAAALGVSRLMLMENAGRAVAEKAVEELGGVEGKKVLILCGPGNNGGDGLVAARHLAGYGADVTVILLSSPDRIKTQEARANYTAVRNMPISIRLEIAETVYDIPKYVEVFRKADIIIDAILGTGTRGRLSDLFASAVETANSSSALRIAVDIPTGIDPDTGYGDMYFEPHLVVTFHASKRGLVSRNWRVHVAGIGIPWEAEMFAGPGQLSMLLRGSGEGLAGGRIAYVYGDRGADQGVRQLLENLPCTMTPCHVDMLITSPQTRQAVASSKVILLAPDVNPNDVRPFTVRSQPMILAATTTSVQNATYVMFSGVRHGKLTRDSLLKIADDVRVLATKIKAPVYVVGEVDAMSDGEETYLNWLGNQLEAGFFKYVQALTAWMMGSGSRPIVAMAAASYVSRSADAEVLQSPISFASYVREMVGL